MKYCEECGSALEEGAKFCNSCGQTVTRCQQNIAKEEVQVKDTPQEEAQVKATLQEEIQVEAPLQEEINNEVCTEFFSNLEDEKIQEEQPEKAVKKAKPVKKKKNKVLMATLLSLVALACAVLIGIKIYDFIRDNQVSIIDITSDVQVEIGDNDTALNITPSDFINENIVAEYSENKREKVDEILSLATLTFIDEYEFDANSGDIIAKDYTVEIAYEDESIVRFVTVADREAPVITVNSDVLTVNLGLDAKTEIEASLKANVVVEDSSTYTLEYVLGEYTTVGEYPLEVAFVDEFGNRTTQEFKVLVVENPEICIDEEFVGAKHYEDEYDAYVAIETYLDENEVDYNTIRYEAIECSHGKWIAYYTDLDDVVIAYMK